jgi:crossover junction endodeoxyribonuclease RuvC
MRTAMKAAIRILGVDPGLRRTGWGVIETEGPRLVFVEHGVIRPDDKAPLSERLGGLFSALGEIARRLGPDLAAVEETFVNVNPRSTLLLGQARGAIMAGLAVSGVPVEEFATRQIKLSVVGTGGADKDQVAFMVRRLLPRAGAVSADAADALAAAICAAHHRAGAGGGGGR